MKPKMFWGDRRPMQVDFGSESFFTEGIVKGFAASTEAMRIVSDQIAKHFNESLWTLDEAEPYPKHQDNQGTLVELDD